MTGESTITAASGTALVALLSWPAIVVPIYALRRGRARVAVTTAWMLLLPLMFLPSATAWDPPLLPPLNKFRVALLSVALALRIFHAPELLKRAPLSNLPRVLFTLFLLAATATVVTNQDSFAFGTTSLPGLTWYDLLSIAIGEFLDVYLPFSIGQRVFRDRRALIDLFKVMTSCALIYAPFMLFEARMSPQLHMWVYGFYPSEFQQAMRGSGFRPLVFMNHGLSVAGWVFGCLCAALTLSRSGVRLRHVSAGQRAIVSWGLLLLTRSLGPMIYAAVATLSWRWSARSTARVVLLVTAFAAAYPVLRAENLIPTERILAMFEQVSAERAISLKFRFDNEDLLLRHAMERPVFGWGTFGRNQVYDAQGKLESVADGEWIITLGTWGYVGHFTFFAMLLMPLLRFARLRSSMPQRAQALCSGLSLLLALFVLDLLPNARSDYLSVIYAGALWTLSERLARRKLAVAEPAAVESYALTRRQTLFWLDEQLHPGVPYHHIVLRLSLSGPLDVERFRAAYARTLAAFDQFRLVFATEGGEPRQRFKGAVDGALPLHDLSRAPESLDIFCRERAQRRFDFGRALFDGVLLKLADDEHVLYFCQHHLISDGASIALFLDDLGKRYRNLAVPERPSYALYLAAEKAYRESTRAQRDAHYFARRLSRGMPPLSLYGRTRQSRSFGSHRSELQLSEQQNTRFSELANDARVELFDPAMSRLVALATLLFAYVYRVGGARSLLLAVPVPNRSAQLSGVGGLLMEQLFLRVDVDDAETFSSLAGKVRSELVSALRHAQHCVSDRELSYVTLNLLRLPAPELVDVTARAELLPLSCLPGALPSAQGDLRDTFGVHVMGFDEHAPLSFGFDFHRETFDAALRTRAKAHFLALFDAMLGDLDLELDAVELCDAHERAQILARGRGREPALPAPDALVQIAAVAHARAHSTAVHSQGESMSYGELMSEVARLATRLTQLGVRRGARVAFCVPRGISEPLSMLATWAAGAAYVPLDESHPAERIRMILTDAAPQLLISHSELIARLSVPPEVRVLLLDRERDAIRALHAHPICAPSDGADAAYVLFTSGSTGRPKGVEVPRRAVANFLRSMAHTPGLKSEDRLLAITTPTFDIATLELLLPLYVGAQVQIADRETALDPGRLCETLQRDGISVLQATPTTWRLMLEAGFGGAKRALKMLCGGEAISRELADELLATGGELWNMYGPTETTVWSTVCRLTPGDEPISIGTPIDATQVYILGSRAALEPLGVSGELCIGGLGVARGYLNRPELTAQRFMQNPRGAPGDVLYRTGDLARYLPDGRLQCLGRVDHQVKVRGFRIELGEIESCLRGVAKLREVVVHPRGASEDPRLVAYYVGEDVSEDALRSAAAHSLPSYMRPSAYVRLTQLPLNTNGKVDRQALPEPAATGPAPEAERPREDATEQRMAELFQEVLGCASVPSQRDFFALGGDSVRVMRLRRRIHEAFGVELSLSVMFAGPTVRSLAAALGAGQPSSSALFVELRPGRPDAAPLICVMGVALYRELALALDTDRAVYGVHVPLGSHAEVARLSVEEIARRYSALIRERVPRGPYHLAGLCFGGVVAFELAHQLLALGHEVRTLAIFDGVLPRGVRRSTRARALALVASPARILERLRARVRRSVERGDVDQGAERASAGALDDQESARLTKRYDARAARLPIPIMLFRAEQRDEPVWQEIEARLGWSELGTPVTLHGVPGTHLGILRAENVRAIAAPLGKSLVRASPSSRPEPAPKPGPVPWSTTVTR